MPSPDVNCVGQEDSRWEDSFDVQDVRDQFPALGRTHNGRGVVYLEPFRRPPRADARVQVVREDIGGSAARGAHPSRMHPDEFVTILCEILVYYVLVT